MFGVKSVHAGPAGGIFGHAGGGGEVRIYILQQPRRLRRRRGDHKLSPAGDRADPVMQGDGIAACFDAGDLDRLANLETGAEMRGKITHGRGAAQGASSGHLPAGRAP